MSNSDWKRSSVKFIFQRHVITSIKIYDVVRIKKLLKRVDFQPDDFNVRSPNVGDVATVVEVHINPPGYELECSGKDGVTMWLQAFAPEDIELELVF